MAPRKPVKNKPAKKTRKPVKKPAARKPAAKKPAARKPAAKKPAARKPTMRKPATRKPVARKPAAKKPAARKPAAKKPAARKPATKKPSKPVKRRPKRTSVGAKAPRGFKPAGQELAREEMLRSLQLTAERLKADKDIDARVYVHVNRDESIDAELKIDSRRGVATKELSLDLEKALPQERAGLWISSGARFNYQNEDKSYSRFKGLSQIQTHYRRYTRTKKALVLLTSRAIVDGRIVEGEKKPGIEKAARKKVDHLFVRLHWNPEDTKPKRK